MSKGIIEYIKRWTKFMKDLIRQAINFFGISGIGWILDMIVYTLLRAENIAL